MPKIDKLDEKIIEILVKNSCISNTEIAKKLKVSEATIRKRIRDLIKNKIIQRFTIEVGDQASIKGIVLIKTVAKIPTIDIANQITKIINVQQVYETTGDYDIIAIVLATSTSSLNESIENIRQTKGVIDTTTLTVVRT